jgi:hypothetical protein
MQEIKLSAQWDPRTHILTYQFNEHQYNLQAKTEAEAKEHKLLEDHANLVRMVNDLETKHPAKLKNRFKLPVGERDWVVKKGALDADDDECDSDGKFIGTPFVRACRTLGFGGALVSVEPGKSARFARLESYVAKKTDKVSMRVLESRSPLDQQSQVHQRVFPGCELPRTFKVNKRGYCKKTGLSWFPFDPTVSYFALCDDKPSSSSDVPPPPPIVLDDD